MKIFFIVFFSFFSKNVFSSDSTNFSCKYRFIKQKDSANVSSKFDDIMILTMSKKKSIYYSYLRQFGNKNFEDDLNKTNPSTTTISIKSGSGANYFINNESEIIELNYLVRKVNVSDKLINSEYEYIDTLLVPKWKIINETSIYLDQKCQKATASFLGRNYIAWFCTSIPYKMGPWFFNGLPGLILKVSDDKNQFDFECIELNTSNVTTKVFKKYASPKIVTKQILKAKKKLKAQNMAAFMQAEDGVIVTNQSGNGFAGKVFDKPYNPIDLTK